MVASLPAVLHRVNAPHHPLIRQVRRTPRGGTAHPTRQAAVGDGRTLLPTCKACQISLLQLPVLTARAGHSCGCSNRSLARCVLGRCACFFRKDFRFREVNKMQQPSFCNFLQVCSPQRLSKIVRPGKVVMKQRSKSKFSILLRCCMKI